MSALEVKLYDIMLKLTSMDHYLNDSRNISLVRQDIKKLNKELGILLSQLKV